jgi:hypothetical protein
MIKRTQIKTAQKEKPKTATRNVVYINAQTNRISLTLMAEYAAF